MSINVLELSFAFDIEAADTLFERVLDFFTGFAHAGERAFSRVATRCEHPIKFAAGNDVETGPFIGEQL